jgi:hypothetical protein
MMIMMMMMIYIHADISGRAACVVQHILVDSQVYCGHAIEPHTNSPAGLSAAGGDSSSPARYALLLDVAMVLLH